MNEVFRYNALKNRRGIGFYVDKQSDSFAYDPYERVEWVERNLFNTYVDDLYGDIFLSDFLSIKGQLRAEAKILELGCATGAELRKVIHQFDGGHFYGVDYSYQLLKMANRLNVEGCTCEIDLRAKGLDRFIIRGEKSDRVSFLLADACSLPFIDESMDYLSSHFLLDRVSSVESYITEIGRVLKRGGKALISTPMNFQKSEDWQNYASADEIVRCFEQYNMSMRLPLREEVFVEKLDAAGNYVHWNAKLFYLEKV